MDKVVFRNRILVDKEVFRIQILVVPLEVYQILVDPLVDVLEVRNEYSGALLIPRDVVEVVVQICDDLGRSRNRKARSSFPSYA